MAIPGVAGQLLAILLGAALGTQLAPSTFKPPAAVPAPPLPRQLSNLVFLGFALLLLGLPLSAQLSSAFWLQLIDAFYRAGALIFGGGHVMLPLLRGEVVVPGWVEPELFVAGYGTAQTVPGPLLAFAAYLGAVARAGDGIVGGIVALVAVFLPSFLLVPGTVPHLAELPLRPVVSRTPTGVNAAVVGLLLGALYDPVWLHAIVDRNDFLIATLAFAARRFWGMPTWALVLACAAVGGCGL